MATRVKIFFIARISRNKSIFIFGLSIFRMHFPSEKKGFIHINILSEPPLIKIPSSPTSLSDPLQLCGPFTYLALESNPDHKNNKNNVSYKNESISVLFRPLVNSLLSSISTSNGMKTLQLRGICFSLTAFFNAIALSNKRLFLCVLYKSFISCTFICFKSLFHKV